MEPIIEINWTATLMLIEMLVVTLGIILLIAKVIVTRINKK